MVDKTCGRGPYPTPYYPHPDDAYRAGRWPPTIFRDAIFRDDAREEITRERMAWERHIAAINHNDCIECTLGIGHSAREVREEALSKLTKEEQDALGLPQMLLRNKALAKLTQEERIIFGL